MGEAGGARERRGQERETTDRVKLGDVIWIKSQAELINGVSGRGPEYAGVARFTFHQIISYSMDYANRLLEGLEIASSHSVSLALRARCQCVFVCIGVCLSTLDLLMQQLASVY